MLTSPAGIEKNSVDQTLSSLEIVQSLSDAQGDWVMFAPATFSYERHYAKNLLLAAEEHHADVVFGAVKGPWISTLTTPSMLARRVETVPTAHVMFRRSWFDLQVTLRDEVVSGAQEVVVAALAENTRLVTIPQDAVEKAAKKSTNQTASKGSIFKNLPAAGYYIAKSLPLKNEILFDVDGDRAIDSAMPYLASEWKSLKPNMRQKWITSKHRGTWIHAWHLGRAQYLVTNEVFLNRIPKREGQVMVVAGAGTPVLRAGRDNPDWVLTPTAERRPAWSQVGRWNLAAAASPFAEQVLRSSTAYVSEVLRVSVFGDAMNRASHEQNLKVRLGLDPDRPLVVCAFVTQSTAPDISAVIRECGERVQFVGISDDGSALQLPDGIQQVSTELPSWLAAADLMITDWSMLAMEFGYLQRPIIAMQLNRLDVVRRHGTYLDLPSVLPGPIVENQESLVSALQAWLSDPASLPNVAERRLKFSQLCGEPSGDSAQQIWDAMAAQS